MPKITNLPDTRTEISVEGTKYVIGNGYTERISALEEQIAFLVWLNNNTYEHKLDFIMPLPNGKALFRRVK